MASGSAALRGHIQEFDGLRGIAILAVMTHHFWPKSGSFVAWSHLAHLGWVGVDLFFVISGCLITGILLDTCGHEHFVRNFYARRALRIFPLYYLFVIAAFIGIPLIQGTSEFTDQSGSLWWYLSYLGNAREALTGKEPSYVLAVTWSLCIEEQFYLSFPLVVALLRPARLGTLLWFLVILALVFRLGTVFLWPENERVQYLATPSRIDVIALGCLIALGFRGHTWLPSPSTVRVFFPALLVVFGIVFFAGGLNRMTLFCRTAGYSLVAFTAFTFVLWVAQRRGSKTVGWLRCRPLTGVGVICYGVYLLQRPAQVITSKATHRIGKGFDLESSGWSLLVYSSAALAAGLISWYLIERPFLRLKDHFVDSVHPYTDASDVGS